MRNMVIRHKGIMQRVRRKSRAKVSHTCSSWFSKRKGLTVLPDEKSSGNELSQETPWQVPSSEYQSLASMEIKATSHSCKPICIILVITRGCCAVKLPSSKHMLSQNYCESNSTYLRFTPPEFSLLFPPCQLCIPLPYSRWMAFISDFREVWERGVD